MKPVECDRVWLHARVATLVDGEPGLGIIDDGVVASSAGRIVFVGTAKDWPGAAAAEEIDLGGRLVTPGLIDCHTHLIHGGNRAGEFEQRLDGASYEELARRGGGIVSTVKATRQASVQQLVETALPRLDALLAEGVTTLEIKSGYGLALEHERHQLQAARELARRRDFTLRTTLLAAHALPPEFAGRADDYIREVCDVIVPAIAHEGLAHAVDVFCEGIGFSRIEAQRVLEAGAANGLGMRIHAEQLSNQHGAEMAAGLGALSADHLEYLDEAGVVAMASAGTTAVLLPGAFYFTRETQHPPLELLRHHGVRVALATDCNPGTSPLTSPLLVMNMAATCFRMTVNECLAGVTREAAYALGLGDRVGTLALGKDCDLAVWDVEQPAELVYRFGFNPLHARIYHGKQYRGSSL